MRDGEVLEDLHKVVPFLDPLPPCRVRFADLDPRTCLAQVPEHGFDQGLQDQFVVRFILRDDDDVHAGEFSSPFRGTDTATETSSGSGCMKRAVVSNHPAAKRWASRLRLISRWASGISSIRMTRVSGSSGSRKTRWTCSSDSSLK